MEKDLAVSKIIPTFAIVKPVHEWAGRKHGGTRHEVPLVRPVSKGVETLPDCRIKLRNFETMNSGDATKASTCRSITNPYA